MAEPIKVLFITQKESGKIVASFEKPKPEGVELQLAIAYKGEIVGIVSGGFYSVPIT